MRLKDLGNLSSVVNEVKKLGSIYELSTVSSKLLDSSLNKLSASQILAKVSTMGLTDAQKFEMVQMYATDAANYTTIGSISALVTAETTATGTTDGLSLALKGLWIKLAPIAPALVAIAAVGATAWAAYQMSTDQVIKRNQKVRETLDENYQALMDEANASKENADKLKDLSSQYENAAKGSKEYYDIANQIAKLSPSLVIGYTNEGNAILDNTEKIKAETEAYRENYEEKMKQASEDASENIDTLLDQYDSYSSKKNTEQKDFNNAQNIYNDALANPDKYDPYILENQQTMMDASVDRMRKYSDEMVSIEDSLRKEYVNLLPQIDESELTSTEEAVRSMLIEWGTNAKLTAEDFSKMYDEISADKGKSKAIENLFNLDTSKMSQEDYQKTVSDLTKKIVGNGKGKEQEQIDFRVAFGFSYVDEDSGEEVFNALDEINEKTQEEIDNAAVLFNPATFSEAVTTLSSLQSVYNDFYNNVKDNSDFTFDMSSIESLREKFGDVCNSFDEFEQLATSSSTSAYQMQSAFDKLATEFVFGSGVLDGLNESNREQIATQLELQGIVGASSLLTSEFAQACSDAESAGIDLANATWEEISAFVAEGQYADETKQKIFAYAIQKKLANENCLNTVGDIAALEELCRNLGVAIDSLNWFARAKSLQTQIDNGADNALIVSQMDTAKNKIKELASEVSVTSSGFTNMGQSAENAAKSASKGAKDSKDTYLEAYKKELAELDHLHEMGIISEGEYYKKLNDLNEKYFADSEEHQKKYLDEYQSNQEKVYKGLLDLTKKLLEEQKSCYDGALSAIEKSFDTEIDRLNDLKDTSKDSYESQIKDIDKKIDRLEKERDARKDAIQDQIDSLNASKKAMQDANDEYDRQIALEKALHALKQAENTKSKVYQKTDDNGGQVIYKNNSRDVSEKRDEVDRAEDAITIANIEKEIDSLESAIDELDDYYDNLISNLEEDQARLREEMDSVTASYEAQIKQMEANKQAYADIATAQKDAENRKMAAALLGANWEQMILSGRLDVLNAFKGGYIGICDEISNADATFGLDASTAAEGYAQSVSDMLAKTESLETLLQSWKDLNTGIGGAIGVGGSSATGEGTSQQATSGKQSSTQSKNASGNQSASSSAGSDNIIGAVQTGGQMMTDTFNNVWTPGFQTMSNDINDVCGSIVTNVDAMCREVVNACAEAIKAINALNAAKASSSSSNPVPSYGGHSYSGKAYASGTENAKKGLNLIGEKGTEIYVDKNDNVKIATKPTLVNMNGGEKVLNNNDTMKVLTRDPSAFTLTGDNSNSIFEMFKAMPPVMPNISLPTYDYGKLATRNTETTIHQDINVTLPNVTNEAGFNNFKKELDQLENDALQLSYRR